MRWTDFALLLSLAALWGGSYLFIRIGAGQFGPVSLAGVRAGGAAVALLPLLVHRPRFAELRSHWQPIAVVGLAQSALPYLLFSYAALSITAGLSAIVTATTPLFAALLAWLWLGERLTTTRAAGLALGFAGVIWLAADPTGVTTGAGSAGLAVAACLGAAFLYGWAATFTKRRLGGVSALTIAAGSQAVSAVCLALPATLLWPAAPPTLRAWFAIAVLAVVCTALAYVMFFRLIARVGPAKTVTVTFLIPAFGVLWGTLFLGETVTVRMLLGGVVILTGTALTTGLFRSDGRVAAPSIATPVRQR